MYFIYILYSEPGDKYYVGYTDDPYRRLSEHNTNLFNTYTSNYRPWKLKAVFECSMNRSSAMKIEKFIKKQKSRKLIEMLCDPAFIPNGLLSFR